MSIFKSMTSRERWLACLVLGLLALAFGPNVTQPVDYHQFADRRGWASVPHALDVLSNLPFAAFGLWRWSLAGGWPYGARRTEAKGVARMARCFFAGLVLTAMASAYYHWAPDNWGLAVDRLGMVMAFAGLLGLATHLHVSRRAGWLTGWTVLLAGPAAIAIWMITANAMPWVCLQLGGMLLLALCAVWKANHAAEVRINWPCVLALYALAKVLEVADHQVFELTQQLVSGHSLKHLTASLAAWPICVAMNRQNPAAQSINARVYARV